MIGKAIFNRAPLPQNQLSALPLGAVQPTGWMLEQLQIQADAAKALYNDCAALNDFCPWLGKGVSSEDEQLEGASLELAPYFADAAVALAYLLKDEELEQIAGRYIEWTLESQDGRGWFGPKDELPEGDLDWWPRVLMLRAMQAFFTATGDKRILLFMDKFFRFELKNLPKYPLRDWACARAGENMRAVLWLYNLTGQNHLLKLCRMLREQSLDWTSHFHIFPHIRAMGKQRPWGELLRGMDEEPDGLRGVSQPYYHREYHLSQGVNVAMALKTPGVVNLFKSGFKEVTAFKVGFQKLMKHHGVAPGMFTADDHLSGTNPSQGSSICAVVELMHTMEALIGLGDEFGRDMPDQLERLAFNSLPASFSPDMNALQPVSQANQVSVTKEQRIWYNAGDNASLFKTIKDCPDDVACAMQGWPRFVESCWYATSDNGLMAVSYAPVSLNFVAGGERVRVQVVTGYPFDTNVLIEVSCKSPTEFPLYLRIPSWAKRAMLKLPEGELMQVRAGETACLRRKWGLNESIRIDLPMEPRLSRWHHQSASVELGPLTLCYRPKEDWEQNEAEQGFDVTTKKPWNFALVAGESMKPVIQSDEACPFKKGDPVRVLVKAVPVEDWGLEGASAQQPPIQPCIADDGAQVIELTPFGCSALRISEFPVAQPEPKTEDHKAKSDAEK